MYIIILGAGKIGSLAASILAQEGHDVAVIDKNKQRLDKLSGELDISTLHKVVPSLELFEELGEHHPELLFAATDDDQANLLSCAIAKNLGCPKTVAIVESSEYLNHSHLDFGRLFFVDHFLSPALLAAQDLFKILIHTGDVAVEHFAHGAIQMRTIVIPERWDRGGTSLKNLSLPEEFIIGLIRRGEQILFPHGNDHLLPGDEITAVGENRVMNRLHEIFHIPEHAVESVILVGGSEVAFHLAELLEEQDIYVRIIERDPARALKLADRLENATIIQRDGADAKFLREERVQEVDALIACTGSDKENLFIASLAKKAGCPKVLALATDPDLQAICETLGITPVLSARRNIANRLLSMIHEQSILSVASLCDDKAKIVELTVPPHSKAVGIPLSDLSRQLPKDLLIAVIETESLVMIGRGSSILKPGDTLIVICAPRHLAHLQELLE